MHENEKKLSFFDFPALSASIVIVQPHCSYRVLFHESNSQSANHFAYYNILSLLSRHDIVVKYELLKIG